MKGVPTAIGKNRDGENRRDDDQAVNVFEGCPVVADGRVPLHWLEQQDIDAEEDGGQQVVDHQREREVQHLTLETEINVRSRTRMEAVTQHQGKESRHSEEVADH